MPDLDTFVRSYFETALWASSSEVSEDCSFEDLAPETITRGRRDCAAFLSAFRSEVDSLPDMHWPHDLWLTRNGHGAGFWDGDYPGELGERLTSAARLMGEVELYVGDDGRIYTL